MIERAAGSGATVKDLGIALSAWADTLAEPLAELREAGSLAETHAALDRLRVAATEVEGRLRGVVRELQSVGAARDAAGRV